MNQTLRHALGTRCVPSLEPVFALRRTVFTIAVQCHTTWLKIQLVNVSDHRDNRASPFTHAFQAPKTGTVVAHRGRSSERAFCVLETVFCGCVAQKGALSAGPDQAGAARCKSSDSQAAWTPRPCSQRIAELAERALPLPGRGRWFDSTRIHKAPSGPKRRPVDDTSSRPNVVGALQESDGALSPASRPFAGTAQNQLSTHMRLSPVTGCWTRRMQRLWRPE